MGVMLMLAGVGIIGALASILASLLWPLPKREGTEDGGHLASALDGTQAILAELAQPSIRGRLPSARGAVASWDSKKWKKAP